MPHEIDAVFCTQRWVAPSLHFLFLLLLLRSPSPSPSPFPLHPGLLGVNCRCDTWEWRQTVTSTGQTTGQLPSRSALVPAVAVATGQLQQHRRHHLPPKRCVDCGAKYVGFCFQYIFNFEAVKLAFLFTLYHLGIFFKHF